MSEDAERIKRLVEFKKKLEKRVEELESEFKEQQAVLEMVNSMLLEKGFRRAEIPNSSALRNLGLQKRKQNLSLKRRNQHRFNLDLKTSLS